MPARSSAQQTRHRLLAAGRKVFASKGLGGASLREDILARAGVSSGSFYHQFEDKADLLVAILRHDGGVVLETMEKGRKNREGQDAVARGRALLRQLFEMTDRHPEFVKIFVREYYSDSLRVRREIRRHSQRTIDHMRRYYDALAESTGVALDTEGIATLMSVQAFALINYSLGFPRRQRAEMRERMIRQILQLSAGGILAIRKGGD